MPTEYLLTVLAPGCTPFEVWVAPAPYSFAPTAEERAIDAALTRHPEATVTAVRDQRGKLVTRKAN